MKSRQAELEAIPRYNIYKVMFYRTNLWNHSRRVAWLVEAISPYASEVFGKRYDPEKARVLALVHDDAEIVTGDVQAGNKSKMTEVQLAEVDRQEELAIAAIAKRFPDAAKPYSYQEMLEEALHKETLEAQVVMLADKVDAFGEALHEVYAGNIHFATNIVNEYGTIPTPYEYYTNYLQNFVRKYPEMEPLFQGQEWFLRSPEIIDFKAACLGGKPHTEESLKVATGYPHYDEWKKLVISRSAPEQLLELVTIIEPK